ncbi:MAG TPA: hypothetical protein PK176_17310, partial [Acidobacteriota bacterium]|nr:hypothetical protein [Acidobacteriota bacterium]
LSVIARTSIMRYKKSDKGVDQIGRELNVDYVLEGSAQREGSRVRVTAELIRVGDQAQLWADAFEREMAGILALQSDVAKKVAGALALKLLPAEQARLTNVQMVNPDSYDAYLKGRRFSQTLTPAGLDTAEKFFNLALAKDPNFALAHAGLAAVWICRQQMWITTPREAGPKAKAEALKALSLDDSLAFVHHTLSGVLSWTDWDWAGSVRERRRTLELDPGCVEALRGYSHVLMILRRPGEAMPPIERAVELDPFNAMTLSFHAETLYLMSRYDEAIAQARQAMAIQPDAPVAQGVILRSQHMMGRHDDAIAMARGIYAGRDPDVSVTLGRGYSSRDYAGAWRGAIEILIAKHGEEPGSAFGIAEKYMFLKDGASALGWLEKACADRDPNLPYINCDPLWAPLRQAPRFQALLRKMNLPADGTK